MKKLATLLTLLLLTSTTASAADAGAKLKQLVDDIWQYELAINPLMASSQGMRDQDHKLPDLSPAALARQHETFQGFATELAGIDKDELSRQQQITLLMQEYRLQRYIDNYRFNSHYVPLTAESGFHSSLLFMTRSYRFDREQDFLNYIQRLSAFPEYFQQQIQWMRKGIEVGMVQPRQAMAGIEESVQAFVKDAPGKSEYFQPFYRLDNIDLSDQRKKAIITQAKSVISDKVFVAYQQFYQFLTDEYLPAAKDSVSALTWPQGKAYYQNQINYYTTTNMSAQAIHQLGLSEVKRIRSEMQQVLDTLSFAGDINEFIEFLRTDPQFYANSAEELIKQASYISKQMDARLPQLFYYHNLPRTPYGVEPVPQSIAPKYTTGRYISPSADDKPGYYWVNTYALDKRPLYALTALTLHEAVPGHHLQNAMAREMEDLPHVRRQTYISAFGEGWGLYSEYLGKEVGMYSDPYDEFGRLSYEMWRACRLVVDTGMHTQGWTRQQAIDYMLENTALSAHNVTTEIDRYITWPAQALSYKIGEIKIKQLRHQAEQALGDKFDRRAFHHEVLKHGSVPLFVLEENIESYIRQAQQ